MEDTGKFLNERIDEIIELIELGLSEYDVCGHYNIPRAEFDKWKQSDKEIADRLSKANLKADKDIIIAGYRAAVGYTEEGKYYPPNIAMVKFWLAKRRPEVWGDDNEGMKRESVSEFVGRNPGDKDSYEY